MWLRQEVQAVSRAIVLTETRNRIRVAAGVLRNARGQVLITDRAHAGTMSDLWEFPGGKLLPDETSAAALCRELTEELGITVGSCEPFQCLVHEYPEVIVSIDFFLVHDWLGEPSGQEGQQLRWVCVDDLGADRLLPADIPVALALSQHYKNAAC